VFQAARRHNVRTGLGRVWQSAEVRRRDGQRRFKTAGRGFSPRLGLGKKAAMQTVEIPREAWPQTLNEFTAIHEGWLISLDVLSPTIGAQPEISNLPLLGISADRIDHDDAITISAARGAAEHMTHTIRAATRVHIERREDGADVALQVESADGTKTILRFLATALPETLDGVVPR
jgi:hypothetical protein